MRKQTAWNRHLMAVYHELKRKNPKIKFGEAMKIAKRSYKG